VLIARAGVTVCMPAFSFQFGRVGGGEECSWGMGRRDVLTVEV
jgi:hypothetical protein